MSVVSPEPPLRQETKAADSPGRLRGRLRAMARQTVGCAGAALSRLVGSCAKGRLGILVYHRVMDDLPGVPAATWNVPPRRFRQQLEGLLERGFQAWPLQEALKHRHSGKPMPAKTFVVTFDDGYENVYTNAWPMLRELQIPATVFLATAYLDSDQPFPCDDWSAAGSPQVPVDAWRPLSTAQCLEMRDSGLIELASHTHRHADFRGRPDDLRVDIETSLGVLRQRFGIQQATFALPYGTKGDGFAGPELSEAAREAGVLCCLTTEGEPFDLASDPFDWPRIGAEPTDNSALLAAKLDGWYSLVRRQWRRARGFDR